MRHMQKYFLWQCASFGGILFVACAGAKTVSDSPQVIAGKASIRYEKVVDRAVFVSSTHIPELEDAGPVFVALEKVTIDRAASSDAVKDLLGERAALIGGTPFVVDKWDQGGATDKPDYFPSKSGTRAIDAQESSAVKNGGESPAPTAVFMGASAAVATGKSSAARVVSIKVFRVDQMMWPAMPPALRPTATLD